MEVLLQCGNGVGSRRRRKRLQERVDVREIFVGNALDGVRRHLAGGLPDVLLELRKRDRLWTKPRSSRRRALGFIAVTLIAAVSGEEFLPVLRVAGWSDGLRHGRRRNRHDDKRGLHRGCETTSTNAGAPRLTTSRARLIAPLRSFGSVIGPSACTPRLRASPA